MPLRWKLMKFLKYLCITSISICLLFICFAYYLITYQGDEIKNQAIVGLNDYLASKVEVESVDLSFLNSFPQISVDFREVLIFSSLESNDTLIQSKFIHAQFNLIDLYNKDYKLKALVINDGKAKLKIDNQGEPNYIIIKKDTMGTNSFQFALEEVTLKNILFSFDDIKNNWNCMFFAEKASLNGLLSNETLEWSLAAKLRNSDLLVGKSQFLSKNQIDLTAKGEIDLAKKVVSFQSIEALLEQFNFKAFGSVNYLEETVLDIGFDGVKNKISSIIPLIENVDKQALADVMIDGDFNFSGTIKGRVDGQNSPNADFNFAFENTDLSLNQGKYQFNKINAEGSITNGEKNQLSSSQLVFNQIHFKHKESEIKGNLRLTNFNLPSFSSNFSANVDLEDFIHPADTSVFESISGKVIADIQLNGKKMNKGAFKPSDFKKLIFNGSLSSNDIHLKSKKENLDLLIHKASLDFDQQTAKIKDLQLDLNKNEAELDGSIFNLIPFILFKEEKLLLDLSIKSKLLDLNSIVDNEKGNNNTFDLPSHISAFINLKLDQLKKDNHVLNNFHADLQFNPGSVRLRHFKFSSNEGFCSGNFLMKKVKNNFEVFTNARLEEMNIKSVFNSFNNFGQTLIKSENIDGQASIDFDFSSRLNGSFEPNLESILMDVNLVVNDGVLSNVKALEALSNYVELEDLKEIKFKALRNQLLIKDCTIVIPKMIIQNSALDLKLAGKHSFKNDIEYKIELYLNDVLGKKVSPPENNEFGYVEDDGLGRTKLFFKMTGNANDPSFSYDKSELKTHMKKQFSDEKRTIKGLLKEEFGWFKKDSSLNSTVTKPLKNRDPFKVEWDEIEPDESKEAPGKEKKSEKKGKFGKFIDKIAKPNEDEFVDPPE